MTGNDQKLPEMSGSDAFCINVSDHLAKKGSTYEVDVYEGIITIILVEIAKNNLRGSEKLT